MTRHRGPRDRLMRRLVRWAAHCMSPEAATFALPAWVAIMRDPATRIQMPVWLSWTSSRQARA
jgi:hypothetical protein